MRRSSRAQVRHQANRPSVSGGSSSRRNPTAHTANGRAPSGSRRTASFSVVATTTAPAARAASSIARTSLRRSDGDRERLRATHVDAGIAEPLKKCAGVDPHRRSRTPRRFAADHHASGGARLAHAKRPRFRLRGARVGANTHHEMCPAAADAPSAAGRTAARVRSRFPRRGDEDVKIARQRDVLKAIIEHVHGCAEPSLSEHAGKVTILSRRRPPRREHSRASISGSSPAESRSAVTVPRPTRRQRRHRAACGRSRG